MTNTDHQSTASTSSAFMLADVCVRPDELKVFVANEVVPLEPRVMDLLVYGSAHAGQLLNRKQILEDVWGGTHVVPEALQRVISVLRKSLRDDRKDPVFIETVSRKGYRFLQMPRPLPEDKEEDIKLTEKSIVNSPLGLITAGITLVLITLFLVYYFDSDDAVAPMADPGPSDQIEDTSPAIAPESG